MVLRSSDGGQETERPVAISIPVLCLLKIVGIMHGCANAGPFTEVFYALLC